jgi:hypothetical protein
MMLGWLTDHPWTITWVAVIFYAIGISLVLR